MQQSIRTFLKAQPQPFLLRAETVDGEERRVRINDSKSKWRDAENCVKGCVRVEAFDRDDNLLRTWEDESLLEQSQVSETVEQVTAAPAPAADDKMAWLTGIAKLLVESADRSAERHAEAYRLAYEQQALLVQTVVQRNQALETAWHRLLMQQQEVLNAAAEADENGNPTTPDPTTLMVMQLLGGMIQQPPQMSAPPSPPSPPSSNGVKS